LIWVNSPLEPHARISPVTGNNSAFDLGVAAMLQNWFALREHGSSLKTECLAGLSTFLAMPASCSSFRRF
jgi:hypothetical protein